LYPSVTKVTLSSLGEPLLHPAFDDILHEVEMQRSGCDINVITNGSLLHKHLRILDTPGSLNISVDTADADIHARMRPGVHLADVVRNVNLVGQLPKHARRNVGIVMVVTRNTAASVHSVGAIAAEAGLNFLAITRGIDLELSTAPKAEEPQQEHVQHVAKQMALLHATWPQLNVQDFFTNETGNPPGITYPHCLTPWLALQVFNDGHVRMCCRAYGVDLGHWSLGNQWEGEKLTRLRQQLQDRNVDAEEFRDCAKCPMH
jgi:MoaA/NifB/PqqE/SkfB family radical SAM enzyme